MSVDAKITEVKGTALPVTGNDIDTDRIIPARFMKEITFMNMGKFAFYDVRFDEDGKPVGHAYDDPKHADFSILVVNKNFGCGSSREHAPQALMRSGVKALVGESFAEIFAGNCTVLGIPVVTAPEAEVLSLQAWVKANPKGEVVIDLAAKAVRYGGKAVAISLPETSRKALVEGTWDSTQLLLANASAVRETAARLPYVGNFAS